ncbi:MAG: hypothetical protein RLY86_1685, partial [Pseudomonadota bacterium]
MAPDQVDRKGYPVLFTSVDLNGDCLGADARFGGAVGAVLDWIVG